MRSLTASCDWGMKLAMTLPCLSSMRVTKMGSVCTPSLAKVEKALTSSKTFDSEEPRQRAGTGSIKLRMPMLWIKSATAAGCLACFMIHAE